jgi:hypothetical protein
MKEHEKMIPELVEGLKSSMVLERRSGMDDPRIGLQVTPQEQGIVPQERNAATTSPNQNTPDSSQIERPRLRSVAGIKLGRPLELHEIPAWYFEAGRVMVAIEEERNAQEKRRKASNATGPPPNSTVQIERGTSEPNQVLSESPESSGAARGHTFQNHHIQKLPPKQQTRKRSSVTRGERESVPKRHQSVVPNPSMPASVTRNDALQEDQMGLYRLDSERREMEQEGQGDTRAHAPKETGISAGSASQTERETSAQSQTVPPGSPQLNIS